MWLPVQIPSPDRPPPVVWDWEQGGLELKGWTAAEGEEEALRRAGYREGIAVGLAVLSLVVVGGFESGS